MQREAGEFLVEVGCCLTQLVGDERLAHIDHFLNHVTAAGDDHHEDASAAQRHELHAVEHRRLVRRADRETDAARRLRKDVRHLRQDGIEQPVGTVPSEPRFHGLGGAARTFGFEQQVHVEAISPVGRNAPGGGMRLLDVPLFLEAGQDVAHRRGGHPQARSGDEHRRGDRLARRDVLAHERGENATGTIWGFH